jgi:hypothetical protein
MKKILIIILLVICCAGSGFSGEPENNLTSTEQGDPIAQYNLGSKFYCILPQIFIPDLFQPGLDKSKHGVVGDPESGVIVVILFSSTFLSRQFKQPCYCFLNHVFFKIQRHFVFVCKILPVDLSC